MAKNLYKKRLKGHYTQGKEYKGDSFERAYAKKEIVESVKEMNENYKHPYKKSKRNRNIKAKLKYKIEYYEKVIELYKELNDKKILAILQKGLIKAKKQYEEEQ